MTFVFTKLFAIPFSLGILFSCAATPIDSPLQPEKKEIIQDEIVFLTFRISKDSILKINTITLLNQKISFGKMKAVDQDKVSSNNYLQIELSENQQLIKTLILEHPLFKHVEYPDESGKMVSKNIEANQDDFFFRIQKQKSPIQVKIFEVLANQPKKELFNATI